MNGTRLSIVFFVASAFAFSGCATTSRHMLPLSIEQAPQSFVPLSYCAQERGLRSTEFENRLYIRYDEHSWLDFTIDEGNKRYFMVANVGNKVPTDERQPRLEELKALGDEIYACAMTHPPFAVRVVDVTPQPAQEPAESPPPAPEMSSCQQLIGCYAKLADSLCEPEDSDCEASFEVEISGDDEELCREMLLSVPDLIQPFKMMNPDFSAPAMCLVE